MLQWLKRKIEMNDVRKVNEDLERFLASLRGFSDEEIGNLLALSIRLRFNFAEAGYIPWEAVSISFPDRERRIAASKFRKLIKSYQKMQTEAGYNDAAGLMIWAHSLNALNYPEARYLGRQIWEELSRGFQHVDNGFVQLERLVGFGVPSEIEECATKYPEGLEPR